MKKKSEKAVKTRKRSTVTSRKLFWHGWFFGQRGVDSYIRRVTSGVRGAQSDLLVAAAEELKELREEIATLLAEAATAQPQIVVKPTSSTTPAVSEARFARRSAASASTFHAGQSERTKHAVELNNKLSSLRMDLIIQFEKIYSNADECLKSYERGCNWLRRKKVHLDLEIDPSENQAKLNLLTAEIDQLIDEVNRSILYAGAGNLTLKRKEA